MSTSDDTTPTNDPQASSEPPAPTRRPRRAATRPAGPPRHVEEPDEAPAAGPSTDEAPASPAPAKRTRKKAAAAPATSATKDDAPPARRTRKKAAASAAPAPADAGQPTASRAEGPAADAAEGSAADAAGDTAADAAGDVAPRSTPSRRRKKAAAEPVVTFSAGEEAAPAAPAEVPDEPAGAPAAPVALTFQAPAPTSAPSRRTRKAAAPAADDADDAGAKDRDDAAEPVAATGSDATPLDTSADAVPGEEPADSEAGGDGPSESGRRRRRRGGRGRRRKGTGENGAAEDSNGDGGDADEAADEHDDEHGDEHSDEHGESDGETHETGSGSSRRRRRRRRKGGGDDDAHEGEDPPNTVTKVREGRKKDEIGSVKGSTRLEAKKQRRREGREASRRRPAILTEAEFLARRESVERVMVVRQRADRTQIAVLEDGILVEHYVNRSSGASMIGNVYLGKVQNVLPSMEAAFIDIGRGRNAVLYAGEVNWDAAGLDGQPRRIELALKSGDSVLVQVTKDPVGHKGARLTSQISLPGRFLVYVPRGEMTGISRKLPDTERTRLKGLLRDLVDGDAGVIVRTAAEGASAEELGRDVARLADQWTQIDKKRTSASAPALLHGEPDLAIKVVRDIFNEDFGKLVVSGDDAWQTIESYVTAVAPELVPRVEKWVGTDEVFHAYRVEEQLAKALDRKVWLPSGGSLVIDRTEAMTVVDVNTGKFTGSGGNLEETVTRNNLEAAEEIVRQLRLRDIGGIIVIDFIDMVLESNRDLVLRRLVECLGRDRTKHQVAEVTSLGLVQMTRKRIGQGLLEVFSESCEACHGRGVLIHDEPVDAKRGASGSDGAKRSSAALEAVAKVHAAGRRARRAEEPAATEPAGESPGDADAPVTEETDAGHAAADVGGVPAEDPAPPQPDPAPEQEDSATGPDEPAAVSVPGLV